MQLFTVKTIINLHENACGGIKFAHKLYQKKIQAKILPVNFLELCFEKSCIILKRNFSGILFQKSLSIQWCCKLNIGYLPEDFKIEYSSAILSKFILSCLHLSLKDCQSPLRRSANFPSILWLSKIILIISVIQSLPPGIFIVVNSNFMKFGDLL